MTNIPSKQDGGLLSSRSWSTTDTVASCCFVEDTCVVVGQTAVINNMGHASRRGEAFSVKKTLEEVGLAFFTFSKADRVGG
jgi:N-dimethylarginine dimethylaminohydrolase